ncbi:hypothetical protein H8959_015183 [Pygathrix nigripes]
MEACLPQLPQRLLLLGAATLTATALETADLADMCGQTWQGDGLLLRSHAASLRFYFVAPDTDCWLWVQAAAPGDRIRFQFRFFLVYSLTPAPLALNTSSPAPAGPCASGSYLQFYEGPPGAPRPLGSALCGLTIPVPVASSGPFLGLRLVTRGRQPRVDFVGEGTSFRLGELRLKAGTGPYAEAMRDWGHSGGPGEGCCQQGNGLSARSTRRQGLGPKGGKKVVASVAGCAWHRRGSQYVLAAVLRPSPPETLIHALIRILDGTYLLPTPPHCTPWDHTPCCVVGRTRILTSGFRFWPQDLVVPTSAARMAGASPQASCVTPGAWTTVATAVTRAPGHQLTAEVPLQCPARQEVQTTTPPDLRLPLQLLGLQDPSGLQLRGVPQQAGTPRDRTQLWKVTPCSYSPHQNHTCPSPGDGDGAVGPGQGLSGLSPPTGPQLRGVALVSSMLLASAGLLMGLLWCCCSPSWLAWQPGACGLCLRCSTASAICYPCPSQVSPGGCS